MPVTRDGVVYNVTVQDLNAAAANCRNTAETVNAQLAQLKAYVVSLEDSWRGIAAGQFQALMQEYDQNAAMLHNALVEIAGGLDGSGQNYGDADQTAYTNVKSINLPPARLS